uniref:CRAL-TRIO domain-containing protein n=1 Tax=Neobodo designis TaxID=312471 RepID=A0A7S1PL95_NEODS
MSDSATPGKATPTADAAAAAEWVPTNDEMRGFHEAEGLSEEELAKVAEVWDRVKAVEMPPSYAELARTSRTLFIAKFLIARQWDVDAAVDMFTSSCEFKIVHQLEAIPSFPAAIPVRGYDEAALQEFEGLGPRPEGLRTDYYARHVYTGAENAWHKWDKDGRPLLFEVIGGVRNELVTRCQALVPPGRPPSDITLDVHLHANEVGRVLLAYKNQGKPVAEQQHQVSVVFDCSGLGMRHTADPLIQLLKRNSTVDKRFFPEGLHRAYVVNAPTMVTVIWAVVKLWLEPRQIEKVKFFKPHQTAEGLREFIDEEHIPAFLGGKCECKGGCVGTPIDEATVPLPVDHTRESVVANRAKETVIADWAKATAAGDKLSFQIYVAQYHCVLRTRFRPDDAGEDWDGEWTDHGKTAACDGVVEATGPGALELELDNLHSMLRSKTVLYRVHKVGDPENKCDGLPNLFGMSPEEDAPKK